MAPHPQRLTVTRRTWALARPFTTAQGVKTTADVVVAEISDGDSRGRGEGVPIQQYGESIDSVAAAIEAMKGAVVSGLNRETLQHALPPGAARNALDCAFWDIDANRAYYGDTIALPDGYGVGWSYIPHFISTRFYTYAYVFAHLTTLALYAQYRDHGASFAERYLDFLAAGGSKAPADLLLPLGVDLSRPDVWDAGFAEMTRMVEAAEQG